ncbi:hypothetical protein K491DRAFT_699594 [Lophiostoma macrostomum CBS 122681]|uniref:Uncharacterized protein n=1 Tax=Lophiostoma macrostomum CBS 122681 TaxID=1314788 RepID=A0A6A6SKH6_9PLEO|nr:hypothetical protein K491DRAFT_699594 [Lophiostoma macrostomum CBS 122681]
MNDETFDPFCTSYTSSSSVDDNLYTSQWPFSAQASYSSPFPPASASISPSKQPWPFDDNQDFSTPPSWSIPSSGIGISEPINDIPNLNCFGSITDVKAQVVCQNRQPALQSSREVHAFKIVEEGAYLSLKYDAINFARLNKAVCSPLKTLLGKSFVQLRAFVQDSEIAVVRNAWYHNSRQTFTLEINVYGAQSDAETAAHILNEHEIFLQYPKYVLEGYSYRNPQFFEVEGFSTGIPDPAIPNTEKQKGQGEETITQRTQEEGQESVSAAVENILDSALTHHVDLGRISVDRRIRQSLRSHQKEAIDFIAQRESGKLSSELSLWKYNDRDQDEPFYQHVFTGAKRPKRAEAKGGIIADEMGLGKTLVILSTIAGTLDRAQDFVNGHQAVEGQRPTKIPSQATLVIVPSSLLVDSWVKEIREHSFPGAISFHRHLGSTRHAEHHLLQQKMIVFTTYATVAIEYGRDKQESPLARINWFRIVLDEAHDIRNPATNQFKAVAALAAQRRWCLTGTPIQNGVDDLGALTTFLKVPILESPQTFAKVVKNPINANSPTRFQNLGILLKTICLRRTRELLDLPEPVPQIRRIPLTPAERADYEDLLHQGQMQIDMAVSGRRKGRINSTVLEALLRLRLFCNNGKDSVDLHSSIHDLPEDPDEALTYLQQLNLNTCAYCSGTIYSLSESEDDESGIIIGKCAHLVCQSCLPQHRSQQKECPVCAKDNKQKSVTLESRPMETSTVNTEYHGHERRYPSKLLAVLSDVQKDAGNKSIIFSCWKKTLKILTALLNYYGIRYNMIDGSLALNDRLKALEDFRSPTGANILLMTLGTGAVGLNLAVATRIYLLEPQWNPSIESQAIGRALRLGQTERVRITRYVMAGTVEESNVLDRQKRKRELAGGGFGQEKDVACMALDIFRVGLPSQSVERQSAQRY